MPKYRSPPAPIRLQLPEERERERGRVCRRPLLPPLPVAHVLRVEQVGDPADDQPADLLIAQAGGRTRAGAPT